MSPRYALRFETGERQGETIPLTLTAGAPFTIGRKPGNALQVPDASVSGRHAELGPADIGVTLRDLDSTNGTRVNGERVRTAVLQHGDELVLGNVHFLVIAEGAAAPADPPLPSLAPRMQTGALPAPGGPGLARTQVQPRDEGLEITADDLARARRGSKLGLVALGVLAVAGVGAWLWLRGRDEGGARTAARPVTPPAGNLLSGYSFESEAGWAADDAAPSVFRATRGARASGELGLVAELGGPRDPESNDGGAPAAQDAVDFAAHASEPARVRAGTALSAEVSARTSGAAVARLGLRFEGSGEAPPTPCTVWSDPIRSEGVHELFVLASVVPPGYDRAAVLLRAETTGGAEGEVALDDAALVATGTSEPAHRVGAWDVHAIGGGRAFVLAKADQVFVSGLGLGADVGAAATPLEPAPTGFSLRAASPGTLTFVAEAPLALGGVATLGKGGYIAHSADFERADATDVLCGKDNDLLRVTLPRPSAVRGEAVGATSRVTVTLAAGDVVRWQLSFDDERVQSQRIAREARFAREDKKPGQALAAWTKLLAEYPFDQALVDEAAAARGELVREGTAEVRELERELERARFFRLVDLYDALHTRANGIAARYTGTEVEVAARAVASVLGGERAALATDLDRHERQRLEAIATFLEASEAPRLAGEVRAYLAEHFDARAAGAGETGGRR